MAERLADVAIGPLSSAAAVMCAMRRRVGRLRLGGTVFCIVQVKTVTDVTEDTWRGFLLFPDLTRPK